MIEWDAARIAEAAGARLLHGSQPGARGLSMGWREVAPGDLFVGLGCERVDGGIYAAQALAEGAWGVLVADEHAEALRGRDSPPGALLAHPDPLSALQALACAWREELQASGAQVIAVTGSTGKTSTKDILAALLDQDRAGTVRPVVASPENLNTEIGLPLAPLAAQTGAASAGRELHTLGEGHIDAQMVNARP